MLKAAQTFCFILLYCFFLSDVKAAGAYLVDDGGIIEKKKFQVENWYSQSNSGEKLYVTNPTYQLFKNAEFAVQETYDSKPRNPYLPRNNQNTLWPQIKYLWCNKESVLSSFVVGENYSSTNSKTYGSYAYLPSTIKLNSFANINFYVGWQNWRHVAENNKSTNFLNYGTGLELYFTNKLSLVSEVFQTNGTFKNNVSKRPALQLGSRYIFSQKLIFDAIYGNNINGNKQNWLTFGATIIF